MTLKIKNKGVTLLEVLAVVIVSTILIIGAFTFYQATTSKKAEQDIISSIASLQMVINEQYHGSSSGYEGVDNSAASRLEGSPFGLKIDGNEIIHQLGGDLIIQGNRHGFQISIEGLDKAPCISLGTRRNLSDHISLGEGAGLDPNVTEITTYCNTGSEQTINYIYTNNLSSFTSAGFP